MQRKRLAALATATLTTVALALPLTAPQVSAEPGNRPAGDGHAVAPDRDGNERGDSLSMPWQRKYQEARQEALEQKLRRGSRAEVQKLGRDMFAKTAQTGKDRIFVVIAEFGDTRHSAYPDDPEQSDAQRFDGPLHNEIPKPDRKVDNSTLWQPDYDRAHYRHMYFKRMKRFYENQSLGRYTFGGDVTEWVKVPFNQARYGRDACGDIVCNNTWFLIRDALAYWTQGALDAGWSMERIQRYLKSFDREDRYDFDGDGDFEESDGYIDHFQIVHAGGDQADGDPIYGSDAIWSHRWYAQINPYGTGPDGGAPLGGVNVGEGGISDPEGTKVQVPDNPTGVWVGDYTIQPENGGLSVFAHEYAHDLGLPDLYDTSGNTGGAENSVGWWSLMSQSRGTLPRDEGIGDRPMPFAAWDKFQLGWLDYATARPERTRTVRLRPSQQKTNRGHNGLIVLLPDKSVTTHLGDPCADCGESYYYSDQGNELDHTMTREVEGGGELTAKVRYEIEEGFDYAFLEASSDGGETWASVPTSESYDGEDSSGFDPDGNGITGSTEGQWVDLTATVPEGTNALRWRYRTDPAFVLQGFSVDNITLAGADLGTAESGPEGWRLDGFRTTTGTEQSEHLNAYFVENRTYRSWDRPLSHLYNFGFTGKRADKVEFFHNQPGALINYWDTSQTDNNVGDHPGEGLILPVDANPQFIHTPDGALARPRIAAWDTTFTVRRSKAQVLHQDGKRFRLPARKAVRVFNDRLDYWYDSDEHGHEHPGHYQPGWYSVDVPKTGTKIRVVRENRRGGLVVRVSR